MDPGPRIDELTVLISHKSVKMKCVMIVIVVTAFIISSIVITVIIISRNKDHTPGPTSGCRWVCCYKNNYPPVVDNCEDYQEPNMFNMWSSPFPISNDDKPQNCLFQDGQLCLKTTMPTNNENCEVNQLTTLTDSGMITYYLHYDGDHFQLGRIIVVCSD
jgi:hypothetical protein